MFLLLTEIPTFAKMYEVANGEIAIAYIIIYNVYMPQRGREQPRGMQWQTKGDYTYNNNTKN